MPSTCSHGPLPPPLDVRKKLELAKPMPIHSVEFVGKFTRAEAVIVPCGPIGIIGTPANVPALVAAL